MSEKSVIVIGAGIAGLTAAALLAREKVPVTLLELHNQAGGCAGTFRRGNFIFDVGATQVAGLEREGNHERIFRYLKIPLPKSTVLDPACSVDLGDGLDPIKLWYEPKEWEKERRRQFPGTESFWKACSELHQSNWSFSRRDPVLPIANIWDFLEFSKVVSPLNLSTALLAPFSIADLLRITGCHKDQRLKSFLDLQLKLYSQEPSDRTSVLYGATVLHMPQKPLGLRHINGSMQVLSDLLMSYIISSGVDIRFNHRVVKLMPSINKYQWEVHVIRGNNGDQIKLLADDIVCSIPPQCLLDLIPIGKGMMNIDYKAKLESLPKPKGAIVFYGALDRSFLPRDCPSHIQLASKEPGSIFISISQDGDGRAPHGQATFIASVFTETRDWHSLNRSEYLEKKQKILSSILQILEDWLGISKDKWLHKELATPKTFQKWTGRPSGIVGGLGQHPSTFGPFGLASRTPLNSLWLCGDSIFPGEGTAAVTQSALMACRQLMAKRGLPIKLD